MKALMSSNFGQILPPNPELSGLTRLKKLIYNVVNTLVPLFLSDLLHTILAGNEDIHNISDAFEIWPDRTKDCGVSCP